MRGGRPCVAIWCNQRLRYGVVVHHDTVLGAATPAEVHATRHVVRARQGLGCDKVGQACDTAGHKPRYGRAQAHDTAPNARSVRDLGAMGAQLGFRVCTLCTQPSFDSMHCSESLFGTLFMRTVHEHCSRGFQKKKKKKKSNQIKSNNFFLKIR